MIGSSSVVGSLGSAVNSSRGEGQTPDESDLMVALDLNGNSSSSLILTVRTRGHFCIHSILLGGSGMFLDRDELNSIPLALWELGNGFRSDRRAVSRLQIISLLRDGLGLMVSNGRQSGLPGSMRGRQVRNKLGQWSAGREQRLRVGNRKQVGFLGGRQNNQVRDFWSLQILFLLFADDIVLLVLSHSDLLLALGWFVV